MIIVEGPEGSGKSVLAETLSKLYELPVRHSGGPPEDEREVRARVFAEGRLYGKNILDRCTPISELVYGSVIEDAPRISDLGLLYEVLMSWADQGWILIYCRPTDDVMLEYVKNQLEPIAKMKGYKPQKYIDGAKANMHALRDKYDEVIEKARELGMEVLTYERS